jgi:hypothetical protein
MPDALEGKMWKISKIRNRPDTLTSAFAVTSASVRTARSLRSTPVFSRRFQGVQVTVHEVEAASGAVSYTTRMTYSYRRATTRKWEFSENIPAVALSAAIKLLEEARDFIARRGKGTEEDVGNA